MLVLDKLTGFRPLETMRRLLRDSAGATAIEYGFLALLLAIPVAACLPPIAITVKAHYMKTSNGFDANGSIDEAGKPKEETKK